MSLETRRVLIGELESALGKGRRIIAYITGTRQWKGTGQVVSTRIATDAVRLCYDHLAAMASNTPREKLKLDLFIFSQGGDASVPWRLVSLFREFASEFRVIVPYTAMSAATLICLGADSIVMGRKGELGPIDPSLQDSAILKIEGERPPIGVEDVTSYIAFVRERCSVKRRSLIMQAVKLLSDQLGPIGLGKLNRQHSYIRMVGERLLRTRQGCDEKAIKTILRRLIEEVSFHGHAISRAEAKELGLHVEVPSADIEERIWKLYLEFEKDYELLDPIDPERWLSKSTGGVQGEVGPCGLVQGVRRDREAVTHLVSGCLKVRQFPERAPATRALVFAELPQGGLAERRADGTDLADTRELAIVVAQFGGGEQQLATEPMYGHPRRRRGGYTMPRRNILVNLRRYLGYSLKCLQDERLHGVRLLRHPLGASRHFQPILRF